MNYFKKAIKFLLRITLLLFVSILIVYYILAQPSLHSEIQDIKTVTVDPLALQKHVFHISENLSPRSYEDLGNLNKSAEYIKHQMERFSSDVSFQNFEVNNLEYKNVIARFGPETDEMMVIGAHYDAMSEYAGADDNASGVAGLIELGKLLSNIDCKIRVELVAYTLEEPPYFASEQMGSYFHAQSVKDKNVKLMISLEMIGYFTDEKDSQYFPIPTMSNIYPSRGNFIAIVDQLFSNHASSLKKIINKYTDLPAYSINAPSFVPGIDYSDHINYWELGIPAIMVTDTSFYRNKHYHTDNDTYEKLDYLAMAKVVYGVFLYVHEMQSESLK